MTARHERVVHLVNPPRKDKGGLCIWWQDKNGLSIWWSQSTRTSMRSISDKPSAQGQACALYLINPVHKDKDPARMTRTRVGSQSDELSPQRQLVHKDKEKPSVWWTESTRIRSPSSSTWRASQQGWESSGKSEQPRLRTCSWNSQASRLCNQNSHASGLCNKNSHASGLCNQNSHASGLCNQNSHASGLCSQNSHASGLCIQNSHASELCSQNSHASELCRDCVIRTVTSQNCAGTVQSKQSRLRTLQGLCNHNSRVAAPFS